MVDEIWISDAEAEAHMRGISSPGRSRIRTERNPEIDKVAVTEALVKASGIWRAGIITITLWSVVMGVTAWFLGPWPVASGAVASIILIVGAVKMDALR